MFNSFIDTENESVDLRKGEGMGRRKGVVVLRGRVDGLWGVGVLERVFFGGMGMGVGMKMKEKRDKTVFKPRMKYYRCNMLLLDVETPFFSQKKKKSLLLIQSQMLSGFRSSCC